MADFKAEDVIVRLTKLIDGRREIGVVHLPTGLFVAEYWTTGPMYKTKERLMEELKMKVTAKNQS